MTTKDKFDAEIGEFEHAVVAAERMAARDPMLYRNEGQYAYKAARARLLSLFEPAPVAVHHVEAVGDEPEHIKITVGDHEVWRASERELREAGDWAMLVRGVGSAVAAVVRATPTPIASEEPQ